MSSRRWRWIVVIVILAAVIILGFWAYSGKDIRHHQLAAAVWTTAVVMLAVLGLLEAAASPRASSKNYGYLDAIVGADGRISTSKTVVFVWTLELAAALTLLGAVVSWGRHAATADQIFGSGDNWDGYFLLLGGPFAAAVAAKGITATTAANDPTAKPATGDASAIAAAPKAAVGGNASLSDIVKNDDGTVSFADSQYSIFSLIAVLYFLGALVGNVITYGKADAGDTTAGIGLPTIPAALLGLTSAAALAYVGTKAVSTQGTRLSSLTPNPVKEGNDVTANVVNLPADATTQNVWITLAKDGTAVTLAPSQEINMTTSTVVFTAGVTAGDYQVVIHTTGYSTPALDLKVS